MRSYKTLRAGGRLIGYGFGSTVKDRRHRAYQIAPNIINWIKVLGVKLDTGQEKGYSLQYSNIEKT